MNKPDYTDTEWLLAEIRDILEFYYPACVDEKHGGFVTQLDEETGEIYDAQSKHLVATSRFIVNFSIAAGIGGPEWSRSMAKRGVKFLREGHFDADTGGYDWLLKGRAPKDQTRVCYGHAFVLLAYTRASEIGIKGAERYLSETYNLLMDRFWESSQQLCRSQFTSDWSSSDDYRGQNANMHTCEALIAAYEATGQSRYLERATEIARRLTVELAEETDGLIWEHYTPEWEHDMSYNRDDPEHKFRPWGYQPGHHAEWSKLLAILDRYVDRSWLLTRSRELFDAAIDFGWDNDFGGFYYTVDPDGDAIVTDKYRWPVAEAIGAAAALYERTNDDSHLTWYERLWKYAENNLVAPGSNWRLKLTQDNEPREQKKGPEVEPGYHPIGACYEGIKSFE